MSSDKLQQFNDWMMAATRYVVVANAGGAIATLGFIGTSMSQCGVPKAAVLPLAIFIAGIVVGSLAILGQLTGTWTAWVQEDMPAVDPTKTRLATRLGAWAEGRTGRILLAAFACFAVGAVVGVASLLVASGTRPQPPLTKP